MPLVYLILSLLLLIFAPETFNKPLCVVCTCIFVLHFYRVIRLDIRNTKEGLVTFNLLIALSTFAVVYVFPLFIYGSQIEYSFRALSVFQDSAVNKVTALSTFGYSVYLTSYEHYLLSGLKQSRFLQVKFYITDSSLRTIKFLALFSVIAFTFNILFFLGSVDSAHNDLTVNTYIAELTKCILTIYLLCSSEKFKEQLKDNNRLFFHRNLIPVSCLIIVMLEYLYIGDRGFVIVGGLTLLFIYIYYVKRIKTVVLIPAVIIAVVLMSLVGQLRKTDSSLREGGLSSFVTASNEIVGGSAGLSIFEYISDLTLVSNVSYLEWDYAEANPFYKPSRIFVVLSMPIPMAPSIISRVMYDDNVSSTSTGYTVTNYYNSQVANSGDGGLGTQVIMDLFMSWHILGVILGMWLLGLLLGRAGAFKEVNIYYLILFITFFGLAIYLPRSTVYMCFRTVVWEIVLLNLITKVEKKIIQR